MYVNTLGFGCVTLTVAGSGAYTGGFQNVGRNGSIGDSTCTRRLGKLGNVSNGLAKTGVVRLVNLLMLGDVGELFYP